MEYLEMHGAVQLKPDVNEAALALVLTALHDTEFVDTGMIDIERKQQQLTIDAEGTVSDGCRLRDVLTQLQGLLAEASFICVTCVRWETNVRLVHAEPSQALTLMAEGQLVYVQ